MFLDISRISTEKDKAYASGEEMINVKIFNHYKTIQNQPSNFEPSEISISNALLTSIFSPAIISWVE